MVKVVSIVVVCLKSGIKQLEEDNGDLFSEMKRFKIVDKMKKSVLWKSEFMVQRVM